MKKICILFTMFSFPFLIVAQHDENKKVIMTFVNDLKNTNYSLEDFLTKYHEEEWLNDPQLKKGLIEMYAIMRDTLTEMEGDDFQIKKIAKDKLPQYPILKGLTWEEGIYLIYYKGRPLYPVLVKKNRIASAIITYGIDEVSKGSPKSSTQDRRRFFIPMFDYYSH